jgi:DNA-binding XRE family transcriptional regulator
LPRGLGEGDARPLPRKRRQRVEARASELIGEELSLRDLRKAHELTQTTVAQALGMSQDGVSRIESRSDLLISTLRSYVEAMGGQLRLVAEFPDRPTVQLSGLAAMTGVGRPAARRATAKKPPRHEAAR